MTPLQPKGSSGGQFAEPKEIGRAGEKQVNKAGKSMNETAWFRAATKGNLYILKESVVQWRGLQDTDGNSAIHYAAKANRLDAVKYLAPMELMIRNRQGQTPLDVAREAGSKEVAAFLRDAMSETSPIRMQFDSPIWFTAAANGELSVLQENLRRFKGYKAPDGEWRGHTALMITAVTGNLAAAQLLATVEAGISGPDGKTALMLACEANYPEIAALLIPLEAGLVDHYGWFALLYAIDGACIKAIPPLYPIEGKMRNEFGLSVLDIARQYKQNEATKILEELAKTN